MATETFTEDDMNRMYHQHKENEFSRNGESIAEKKEDFKRQLREARGEQSQTVSAGEQTPANDNQKQPQPNEALNNSHNSGQGQKSDKAKDKEAEKQKFKDLLREARGEQRDKQHGQFAENSKDVAGDKVADKEAAHKTNGKDITEKTDKKDTPGKHSPQPPTPSKSFTRTFGRDRD